MRFLGVERIFPATTNCVLLGKGREVDTGRGRAAD